MDSPRRPDRDSDPESAAAYEQAGRFREALREDIQKLDDESRRLHDELTERKRHGHTRLAAQAESGIANIDAERRSLTRMLSELDRRFPES